MNKIKTVATGDLTSYANVTVRTNQGSLGLASDKIGGEVTLSFQTWREKDQDGKDVCKYRTVIDTNSNVFERLIENWEKNRKFVEKEMDIYGGLGIASLVLACVSMILGFNGSPFLVLAAIQIIIFGMLLRTFYKLGIIRSTKPPTVDFYVKTLDDGIAPKSFVNICADGVLVSAFVVQAGLRGEESTYLKLEEVEKKTF